MRRRLAASLLATLIVLPVVAPASAAEPTETPSPDASASTEPTPVPEPAPTPAPAVEPAPARRGARGAAPAPRGRAGPRIRHRPSPTAASTRPGRFIVVLKASTNTTAKVKGVANRAAVHAERTFTRAFRGFTASLDASQRRALLRDPNVVAVVPDEIVHLTAQTIPTGVSRIGARSRTSPTSMARTSASTRTSPSSTPASGRTPT